MKTMHHARRLIALLCLAALILALLASAASGLPFAILVPLWFFVAAVVAVTVAGPDSRWEPYQAPFLAVFAPRPPPVR